MVNWISKVSLKRHSVLFWVTFVISMRKIAIVVSETAIRTVNVLQIMKNILLSTFIIYQKQINTKTNNHTANSRKGTISNSI